MRKKRIVFIINSLSTPHSFKRINEFVANGYDVEVYGFTRNQEPPVKSVYDVKIIGNLNTELSYMKRIPIIIKGIRNVVQVHKRENVVYYLFQLDIALAFKMSFCNKQYIYEEPDLMHTYIKNKFIKGLLDVYDKYIIKKSLFTIFTSEGFVKYHFKGRNPKNTCVISNRLNPTILNYSLDLNNVVGALVPLKIGFVGGLRFKSIKNFIDVFCQNFPESEFHSYGTITVGNKKEFEDLKKYSNYFYHGSFKNPDDLMEIYKNIDLVLATYDVEFDNVRYAEPNKLYEAVYFETPIVVSTNTFLADKVKCLGIGYDVDPLNKQDIINLIIQIKEKGIEEKKKNCKAIPKSFCINDNTSFFEKLDNLLKC